MILDGKIIRRYRCKEPAVSVKVIDLWHSGKAHAHGSKIRAVLAPDGFPLWVLDAEPGPVHDLTAARLDALPALYRAAAHRLARRVGSLDQRGCRRDSAGSRSPSLQRLPRGFRAAGRVPEYLVLPGPGVRSPAALATSRALVHGFGRRHPQPSWVPPITGDITAPVATLPGTPDSSLFTGPGQVAPEEMLRQFQSA